LHSSLPSILLPLPGDPLWSVPLHLAKEWYNYGETRGREREIERERERVEKWKGMED